MQSLCLQGSHLAVATQGPDPRPFRNTKLLEATMLYRDCLEIPLPYMSNRRESGDPMMTASNPGYMCSALENPWKSMLDACKEAIIGSAAPCKHSYTTQFFWHKGITFHRIAPKLGVKRWCLKSTCIVSADEVEGRMLGIPDLAFDSFEARTGVLLLILDDRFSLSGLTRSEMIRQLCDPKWNR